MSTILIVANRPSDNCTALRDAVVRGAQNEMFDDIRLVIRDPLEAVAENVLEADAIIVGTTENFGYMSGLIKDFFERIYYPCLEKTEAMPCALYVKGGLDGQGARTSMEKIITGLRWRPIAETLILHGSWRDEFLDQCEELGMQMAAGLDAGIY